MGNYVIAGRGDISTEVLAAGLGDLGSDHTFFVPWVGSQNTVPTEGMKKVYDFLVDNALTFVLLAKDRASIHPAIATAASQIAESGNVSPELNFDNVPPDATALVLWSDDFQQHSEGLVCEYFDRGHTLLDLSNGLTPIVVEAETTALPEQVADRPIQEDEIPPLTDEDLATMPDGVRKQLERSLGDNSAADLPDPPMEEAEPPIEEAEPPIEEVEATILQFIQGGKKTDETQYATVVVVLPTGRSFTTSVPMLDLWDLMNATVWDN